VGKAAIERIAGLERMASRIKKYAKCTEEMMVQAVNCLPIAACPV